MSLQPHASRPSQQRPKFAVMWRLFQDVAPGIDHSYPDGVIADLQKVGDKIGGAVKKNFDLGIEDIRGSPAAYPTAPNGFTNACATRMSYVLNYSGVLLPEMQGYTVKGADHRNYIFRVRKIEEFVPSAFGPPTISKGPGALLTDFQGKRGIIIFDIPFSDASGHVTLWDGRAAADEDYFNPASRHQLPLIGVRLWTFD